MTPFLEAITITNFRSIRGSIEIPLGAPVVLIHGQNGTGKTSILSAIELALTRAVPSLHRLDGDYLSHLIHKDFDEAVVSVKANDGSEDTKPREIRVKQGKVTGKALLSPEHSTFFSERCYLAQATLSRLLELYQGKEKKNDSQLTKFVKDLLGLDHLDALIEGLDDAGFVTRLRAALPAFKKAHDDIPLVETIIQDRLADLAVVVSELSEINDRVRQSMALLGHDALMKRPPQNCQLRSSTPKAKNKSYRCSLLFDATSLQLIMRGPLLKRVRLELSVVLSNGLWRTLIRS